MLAHRAVRTLMNEAAQHQNIDPDHFFFFFFLRICRSGWRACAGKSFKYESRSGKAASVRGA